jgi:hypothetical protein
MEKYGNAVDIVSAIGFDFDSGCYSEPGDTWRKRYADFNRKLKIIRGKDDDHSHKK